MKDNPNKPSDFEGNEKKKPKIDVQTFDQEGNKLVDITDPDKTQGFCPRIDLRKENPTYDKKLWNELIEVGRTLEKGDTGATHQFPVEFAVNGIPKKELEFEDFVLHRDKITYKKNPFIEAIIETLRYYGADENQVAQMNQDLYIARYKIWDLLGMYYTGALWAKGRLFTAIENLVKLYILQKDVGGFCWWLRGHDLDVEEPSYCKDCITSYKNFTKEIPKGRTMNDFR